MARASSSVFPTVQCRKSSASSNRIAEIIEPAISLLFQTRRSHKQHNFERDAIMNPSGTAITQRPGCRSLRLILLGSALLLLTSGAASAADAGSCAALTKAGLFEQTTIASAKMVAADPAKNCPPIARSRAPSRRGRLLISASSIVCPRWNGRIVGVGGGGFAGDVSRMTRQGSRAASRPRLCGRPDRYRPSQPQRPGHELDPEGEGRVQRAAGHRFRLSRRPFDDRDRQERRRKYYGRAQDKA